jgi:DNA-binding XRE family transcriptional regulator/RNase H-fold protein (predicted Holliday junction resolvase)
VSDPVASQLLSLDTYRKRFGVSQRTLAATLGCSERAVQRYEAGALPDLVIALKLELLYRVPVQTLFAAAYARLQAAVQPLPAVTAVPLEQPRGHRLLAIDPSTKVLGVAVLEGDTLLHSSIRHLPKHDLPDRLLGDGMRMVDQLTQQYQPATLVVPLTTSPTCTRSSHVRAFCWHLRKLAHRTKLHLEEIAPDRIHRVFGDNTTQHDQALQIAARFSAVHERLPERRRVWEPQNPRMREFSAIALAVAADAHGDRAAPRNL